MLSFVTPGFAQAADDAHIPIAETHEGSEAHGGEHGAFPPFDPASYASQLFWLAITFAALYWVISRIAAPRIGEILDARSNAVAADLAAAGQLKGETDAAIAEYEQALAEARQRAQTIAQSARDQAKADADAERKRLEADVTERMQQAEARIADVKARALNEVDTIAQDAAETLVQTLLGAGVARSEVAEAVSAAMREGA